MRVSIKIVGAAGQGLVSIGDILMKGFKRSGYCAFGYREFMSVIKGGHGSYQIDISNEEVRSSEEKVNVVIALNHHGFENNLVDLKDGGLFIHDTTVWEFSKEDQKMIKEKNIQIVYLPVAQMLTEINAKPILANVTFSAFAWAAFGGETQMLKDVVGEKFAKKKDLLEMNMKAVDQGMDYHKTHSASTVIELPTANKKWADHLLLTGSQAMGLGVVRAGVRFYAGYPMTPSSPMLTYISEIQNETGMIIKQAEDEITAVQMMSGAMLMGTRAMTGTSGGGFDLMTETISLNGIIENPAVIMLGQRPGPATGLPTWTAQGDLFLAIYGGHGEFARCVLSVSDSEDAFSLVNDAFNIAEEYQTPVIIMTDKHVAEGIFTQKPYDQKIEIKRGKLVTKAAELKKLKSTDRYDPHAEDGISPRWLPGSEAATYVAQGDEHNADGSVDESAENAKLQMEKRMRKMDAIKKNVPEPELFIIENEELRIENSDKELDLLIVGWGSTKGAILDAMENISKNYELKTNNSPRIGYLHYTYLWPLKGERFEKLSKMAQKTVVIEGNFQSQLAQLLRQETGIKIEDKILKYDGRPFFLNELTTMIQSYL